MKALITGASSGIGRSFAYMLADRGYDLILVARRKKRLDDIKKSVNVNVDVIDMDISTTFNCHKLYNKVKKEDVDIVINAAGFGLIGEFKDTNLDRELDMVDLNVKSVHVLTKLFLYDFIKKDSGHILNVASIAAFEPGPLMATYYASKSYVYNLSMAINYELKKKNSHVYVGVLCPGPVDTEFNKVANVKFNLKSLDSDYVAKYTLNKMFKGKKLIIPGFRIKIAYLSAKFLPLNFVLNYIYKAQEKKHK